ncbi:large subunit GTPase 1 homolog [Planococcus citri]|uniref:large subunit GTPase 1 homolog n=1 Tax=Planococcus citri TaxID=170843 RepID=UPI0031F794D9
MGKNRGNKNLGRALIKDRFGNKLKKLNSDSFLHTSELKDGYDWSKLNLNSVTEEDSFKEFLSTAELAGTEFAAEKLNITFVNPKSGVGLLTSEETRKVKDDQNKNKELLKIPRRPKWDENTTAEELQNKEKEEFLAWRRNLALFQEESGLLLTPYEKNLDFWRQLWRVVERSDVLVQIVDARNPLLFRCDDLELYVKEVDKKKLNLILCNKADFLTREQRRTWAKYFDSIGVAVVFFSALKSTDNDDEVANENIPSEGESEPEDEDEEEFEAGDDEDFETDEEEEIIGEESETKTQYHRLRNSSELLSRSKLIDFLRNFPMQQDANFQKDIVTIGLVGYPNVGKSSTINALLTYKKVSVSATPGKTKHFQTVYLDKDILLCDCPGLVMPSFVLTKADMVINGILPIDQMRDHVPPVNLVCTLIPRYTLESKYGIMIPKPEEGEDPTRAPHSEELLNAYAYNRGFMTANGQPDNPRAARYILKDYVNGKLLYCYAPPNTDQKEFHTFEKPAVEKLEENIPIRTLKAIKPFKVATRDLEYSLFKEQSTANSHSKGLHKFDSHEIQKLGVINAEKPTTSKPWKNHKEKRNKHEKLRIKYRCLDE